MYNILHGEAPTSKLYVSRGQHTKKIDTGQPPSKKQPFVTIMKQAFTHSVPWLPLKLKASVLTIPRLRSYCQKNCTTLHGRMSLENCSPCNTLGSSCPCQLCLKETFSMHSSKPVPIPEKCPFIFFRSACYICHSLLRLSRMTYHLLFLAVLFYAI